MKYVEIIDSPTAVHKSETLTIVHRVLEAGGVIPVHAHPEAEVFFVPVKGRFQVTVGGEDEAEAVPGQVVHFDGVHSITATCKEDSEAFVFLQKK